MHRAVISGAKSLVSVGAHLRTITFQHLTVGLQHALRSSSTAAGSHYKTDRPTKQRVAKMKTQQATLGSLWKTAASAPAAGAVRPRVDAAKDADAEDGPIVKRRRPDPTADGETELPPIDKVEKVIPDKVKKADAEPTAPAKEVMSLPPPVPTTAVLPVTSVKVASELPSGNPSDATLPHMTAASYHPIRSAPWRGEERRGEERRGEEGSGKERRGEEGRGEVPFAALSSLFSSLEGTTKRIAITLAMTNFFRSIIATAPADLLPTVYICTNSLAPAYASLELGVGDSLLIKALSEATGRQAKDIKAEADEKGDLGLVAENARAKQKTLFGSLVAAPTIKAATIRSVYNAFKTIAMESGKSSQEKKVATIKKMLVSASGTEAKYMIRALQGKLRIGLAKQTVLVALAHAFAITPPVAKAAAAADPFAIAGDAAVALPDDIKSIISPCKLLPASLQQEVSADGGTETVFLPELNTTVVLDNRRGKSETEVATLLEDAVRVLKQVYSELPSYDVIIPALLSGGIAAARAACTLTPGIPVTPMLAKPTKGVREVLTRFENVAFTCEWKYDGERAQVHKVPDGRISIFSRNSENTTGKYPDLGMVLQEAVLSSEIPITSCVLDGEVIAYDREKGQLLPFQVLSTRGRKDVAVEDIKVQVIYVAFDLLYINGFSLLHTPLANRRAILRRFFKEVPGKFGFSMSFESSDVEEIGAFLNDSVKGGCEGLMVKVLDGPDAVYEPSKRSLNWLKLKKDYMDGLTDSLDLVPIGAWVGKGKRTGVYGAYLLACYDPEDEMYQSVTRIGTGFSDEMLAELTAAFKEKGCLTSAKPTNVMVGDTVADCDVWFDPDHSEVWEVMAADLSISPVHKAALGKVDPSKGIALRFPRFLRRRDDKSPADATSADQVADMYRAQSSTMSALNDDDDWDM